MSVYTVHEPPPQAADATPDPERFVLVRDGFSFWAFLFAPLWMLWHRLWLVFVCYVAVSVAVESTMAILGASAFSKTVVGLLISLLVGLEAGTLRRFTLRRRGWKSAGIVSGDDVEDAERRFFETWLQGVGSQRHAPSGAAPPMQPPPIPRMPRAPDVIGLFPEPGANR